jgi:hypothetical protein
MPKSAETNIAFWFFVEERCSLFREGPGGPGPYFIFYREKKKGPKEIKRAFLL